MKVLKLTATVLFILIGVVIFSIDSPRPYTRQVHTAQNVWIIGRPGMQGTASPVHCKEVNGQWVVTFLTANHLSEGIKDGWRVSLDKLQLNGGSLVAEHPSEDAALIAFTSAIYIDIVPLTSRLPMFGERVWAAGYPGFPRLIITEGIVSHKHFASTSSYLGCSGGPVIDSTGRVLGIVLGVLGDVQGDKTIGIQHVMRFTPIIEIASWLTAHNIAH